MILFIITKRMIKKIGLLHLTLITMLCLNQRSLKERIEEYSTG